MKQAAEPTELQKKQHPLSGKKVLLTTRLTDVSSGGSMQMFLLAKGLCGVGAKVDVLFMESETGRIPKLDLYKTIDADVGFFRPDKWWKLPEINSARDKIKKNKYDIIHSHKGADLRLMLIAARGIDIPVFVNTRGVNFPLGINYFQYNDPKLDRIVVVSRQSKKVMFECGVKPEKIEVIYGGVDTERFQPESDGQAIRKEFNLPENSKLFTVVANLVWQKGHRDYLRAAAILKQNHNDCYHLFAGSGNPDELKALAAELHVDDRVIFAGFRQDTPALFSASFASAFAGYAGEGVSGVLRESLACSVPVITTDVGGNAELVVHEKYGLVTPMRDPQSLADAMTRMIENPDLAKNLANAGYEYISKYHSVDARNKRIFDLYCSIAHKKGYDW